MLAGTLDPSFPMTTVSSTRTPQRPVTNDFALSLTMVTSLDKDLEINIYLFGLKNNILKSLISQDFKNR